MVASGWYAHSNRSAVLQITRDSSGVQAIAQLDELNASVPATIMSPWGRRHFALAYATRVERRFSGWRVAHHAENWREIIRREAIVYTNADSIYGFGPGWWRKTLDAEPYFSAAGPGWVAVSLNPIPMLAGRAVDLEIAPGMHLAGWTINEEDMILRAVMCWQALRPPGADYSTFVHLGSVAEIVVSEQLVASSDHATPVDGWRPTSRWLPEEIICDAHRIPLHSEVDFDHVIAGMYKLGADGGFQHLGSIHWERKAAGWTLTP